MCWWFCLAMSYTRIYTAYLLKRILLLGPVLVLIALRPVGLCSHSNNMFRCIRCQSLWHGSYFIYSRPSSWRLFLSVLCPRSSQWFLICGGLSLVGRLFCFFWRVLLSYHKIAKILVMYDLRFNFDCICCTLKLIFINIVIERTSCLTMYDLYLPF